MTQRLFDNSGCLFAGKWRYLILKLLQFIGNVVYSNFVANLPLAAAITVIPIVVMVIYLLVSRRFGAFEHV